MISLLRRITRRRRSRPPRTRAPRRAPRASQVETRNSRRAPRAARLRSRRGVLLLVVLSVLVLFLMIGTAFVIVAKQSDVAGKSTYKAAVRTSTEAAQGRLLDEVLLQVVRDTNNPHSAVRFHSLLGDMYGNDGFASDIPPANTPIDSFNIPLPVTGGPSEGERTHPTTTVRWAAPVGAAPAPYGVTGGQIVELDVVRLRDLYGNIANVAGANAAGVVPGLIQSPAENALGGLVLTFTSGPARNVSTRIVGSINQGNWITLRVMAFKQASGASLPDTDVGLTNLLATSRLLVNGRPYNGTGVGFNPFPTDEPPARGEGDSVAAKLSALEVVQGAPNGVGPLALLPNAVFFNRDNLRLPGIPGSANPPQQWWHYLPLMSATGLPDFNGRGGADETYDIVDFQNMALALVPGIDGTLSESAITQEHLPTGQSGPPRALPTTLGPMVLPSWHRPELIYYWSNRVSSGDLRNSQLAANATLLRKILLRPNWLDHPNFTGSNPEFAAAATPGHKLTRMVYGPWDVDNDNDGVRDSIWVDVGLPIMAGPNGKLVKPLAAMLIVDLDGRLNVNAHGTLDLARETQQVPDQLVDSAGRPYRLANDADPEDTARGGGYGPGDVNLEDAIGMDDFKRLLRGERYIVNGDPVAYPGRYGVDDGNNPRPAIKNTFDFLSQVARLGWPHWADGWNTSTNRLETSFVTPPDLRARYGLGVDYFGRPVFEATIRPELVHGDLSTSLVDDSPYELNLSQATAPGAHGTQGGYTSLDAPFAVAELERVLRVYDADAGTLPARLARLAGIIPSQLQSGGTVGADPSDRNKITTDSFDLPAPNIALPHELRPLLSTNVQVRRLPRSTAELFEMRVRTALGYAPFPEPLTDPAQQTQLRNVLRAILAPELADGLRLNVNRPLGNGRDDNGNGVVDEPPVMIDANNDGQLTADEIIGEDGPVWQFGAADLAVTAAGAGAATYAGVPFPLTAAVALPDGTLGQADHRQLLARHLYTLALTLTADPGFNPLNRANPPARLDKLTGDKALVHDRKLARTLAQWAANVVDFRDPDNIMTLFEYDADPFDGWNVDGQVRETPKDHLLDAAATNPNSEQITYVFGAERPELLVTETLTWHDRRTDDGASENPYPPTDKATSTSDTREPDPDYDQSRRPRGATFIELYNPWAPAPAANQDIHAVTMANGARADLGVDLSRTHNNIYDGADRGSPVWRMVVYKRPTAPGQYQFVRDIRNWDPDDVDNLPRAGRPGRNGAGPLLLPDRSVYFCGFDPDYSDDGTAFFNNINPADPRSLAGDYNPVPPVRPGRYLVVGSGDDFNNDGVYENPIGSRLTDRPGDPSRLPLRRIELATRRATDAAALQHSVRLMDDDDQPFADMATGPNLYQVQPTGGQPQFLVQAPSENNGITNRLEGDASQSIADVAIIDQVYDRGDGILMRVGRGPRANEPATPYETGLSADDLSIRQRRRRFTLSEPAIGYPMKFRGSRWREESGREGQYRAGRDPNDPGNPAAIDIPLDGPLGGIDDSQFDADNPMPYYLRTADAARMTMSRPGNQQDPRVSYAFIYLQRLANPLLPWNPEPGKIGHRANLPINPYMTVDSASSNLTVFNGQEPEEIVGGDPEEVARSRDNRVTFASLQRGYHQSRTQQGVLASLIGSEPPSADRSGRPGNAQTIEPIPPTENIYRRRAETNSHNFDAVPFHTLGFLNTPLMSPDEQGELRQAKPRRPLSWLTWNNRPYISANELLMAPKSAPSKLLRDYSTAEGTPQGWSPYEPPETIPTNTVVRTVFGHLLSFFYEERDPAVLDQAETAPGTPLHMYRLLEFVDTPSLFAGTQTWLNPTQFTSTAAAPVSDLTDPRLTRQPPFNSISEFRDPGRINLNTVFGEGVWEGIFHGNTDRDQSGDEHPGPDFDDEFVISRRRYGQASTDSMVLLDSNFPTFFAGAFRSPDAGDLVPPLAGANPNRLVAKGLECTLLRPWVADPQNQNDPVAWPLFAATTDERYNDARRHPYMKFQPMVRLDNLATNRSHVFAIWITIGFFEVEELNQTDPTTQNILTNNFGGATLASLINPTDNSQIPQSELFKRVYPDGYMLGREDGADTGDIRRLRGFYIIDRSLPAGFEPGADHNVENVIRLRRRIE